MLTPFLVYENPALRTYISFLRKSFSLPLLKPSSIWFPKQTGVRWFIYQLIFLVFYKVFLIIDFTWDDSFSYFFSSLQKLQIPMVSHSSFK